MPVSMPQRGILPDIGRKMHQISKDTMPYSVSAPTFALRSVFAVCVFNAHDIFAVFFGGVHRAVFIARHKFVLYRDFVKRVKHAAEVFPPHSDKGDR